VKDISAAELLQVWEMSWQCSPPVAASRLLSAACPDAEVSTLEQLTVGQRDALLLTLREWTFGQELESVVNCAKCGERLELHFSVNDTRLIPPVSDPSELESPDPLALEQDGYQVHFRLPFAADVEASASPMALLERCLLSAAYQDEAQSAADLPEGVVQAIEAQMAAVDPQSDVRLELTCPVCGHTWEAIFDVAAFLWAEVDAWAQRTMVEVHQLANSYSWAEADILAMSPVRRQIYLNMCGGG
jgi:uncharacterized protein (UPF0212 family)